MVSQNDDDVFYSKLEREHANTGQYIPRKDLPSSLRDPDCIRNFVNLFQCNKRLIIHFYFHQVIG